MRHALAILALGLFSSPVFAVDTSKCPETFTAEISRIAPSRTSVNADIPGWVSARDALAASPGDRTLEFNLESTAGAWCSYSGGSEALAKLFTISEFDSEDNTNYISDRLLIEFSVGGIWFSVFPEVESYDLKSIRLYSQEAPQRTRIRTRLIHPTNGKRWNYNVGLLHVMTK